MYNKQFFCLPPHLQSQLAARHETASNALKIDEIHKMCFLFFLKHEKMMKEIQTLQEEIVQVKTTIKETVSATVSEEMQKCMQRMASCVSNRSCLKKDLVCQIGGCGRIYSSVTALRAHMRSKHCKPDEQSGEFIPLP